MSMTAPVIQPPEPRHDGRREFADLKFFAQLDARPKRRRWWIGGGVVGVAAVAAGTTIAATGVLSPQHATVHDVVACYAVATLSQSSDVRVFATNLSVPDQAAYAADTCGFEWEDGILHLDKPYITDPANNGAPAGLPVPPLVACVLKDGMVAVYPGDSTVCRTLGLAPYDPGTAPPPTYDEQHPNPHVAPAHT
jgi:hypothetical protein